MQISKGEQSSVKKAAFLDRDGVINRKRPEGEYVTRWEDFEFLPGVSEAISALVRTGFEIIVISNQRCVAKGLLTMANLQSIHQRMCQELALLGATISDGYYCPHEVEPACNCRKPAPGLLLRAAEDHGINLAASWMIGDSESDVQAGRSAGCRTARILSPADEPVTSADVSADSLLSSVRQILATGS